MRRFAALLLVAACADAPGVPDAVPWRELELPEARAGEPRRRLEAAVAALGTELVIAGGYETSLAEGLAITDEVIAFDTLTSTWRELPDLPIRVTHGALAANGPILYALGGHEDVNSNATGRTFVLEAGADAWIEVEPMPSPRGAAAVLVARPFVYLFGGMNADQVFADVLAFDTISRTWVTSPLPPLPLARSHAAVMRQLDGTIVVAGGLDASNRPLGDVWRLRPAVAGEAPRWEPADPMPTNRGGCVYGTAYGALLCAGGEAGTTALDVVERYDPDGLVIDGVAFDQWLPLPVMPEPRAGATGAVIGGKLYVVGGSRSLRFEPTSSIFVFSFIEAIQPEQPPG